MPQHGVNILTYRVRGKVLGKYLGQICAVLAVLNTVPLAVALLAGEGIMALWYLLIVVLLALPILLTRRLPAPPSPQTNEALVITVLTFLLGALSMVLPFKEAGLTWLDALFEALSGATTTGLSMVADPRAYPHSFLFGRAWLQWYSGLAIAVLSLVLILGPGATARRLAAAGGDVEDLIGTSRTYALRILAMYLLLTALGIAAAFMLGTQPLEALLHILSAVSTGGFSSFGDSLSGLDSWGSRAAVLATCFAGAIPMAIYYQIRSSGLQRFLADPEVWGLALAVLLVTTLLWLSLVSRGHFASNEEALLQAAAMVVSAQTTSGFATLNVAELDAASKGILIVSMALGGGLGSSAGGIKIVRLLIVLRVLQILILRTALPRHAVTVPRLHGHRLEDDEIQRALVIILLYGFFTLGSWLPFLAYGYAPLDALFEVVSALGTVGLSTGVTDPGMAPILKGILCLDMLMGRVEIIAFLVLCSPSTWFSRRTSNP